MFKAMFSGEFKEAKTSKVNLPGKKIEEIGLLLDFLYPDSYCHLTGKTKESVDLAQFLFSTLIVFLSIAKISFIIVQCQTNSSVFSTS